MKSVLVLALVVLAPGLARAQEAIEPSIVRPYEFVAPGFLTSGGATLQFGGGVEVLSRAP